MANDLRSILLEFSSASAAPWSSEALAGLDHVDPSGILGRNSALLRADWKLRISYWLGQSVISPDMINSEGPALTLQLRRRIEILLDSLGAELSMPERRDCISSLLSICESTLRDLRPSPRRAISLQMRRELVYSFPSDAFCWICGFRFSAGEVRRFITGGAAEQTKPVPLVDFLYPRGIRRSDNLIAIDHVTPLSRGGHHGIDNFRLCCGFCNLAKSDGISIFESRDARVRVDHPELGPQFTPRPFWVARMFAINGACSVCERRVSDTELRASAFNGAQTLNPLTLRVYCTDHDPLIGSRYVSRECVSMPT